MGSEIITKSDSANLDLLVFRVGGRKYGINIAKVKEIVNYSTLTSVPRTHPYIEGIFMPRDAMISVVDMRRVFQCGVSEPGGSIVITSFNSLNMAFHVDSVAGIVTITWKDIMPPEKSFGDTQNGMTTGVVRHKDDLIIVPDFEKIVSDISVEAEIDISGMEKYSERDNNDLPILIAEDSQFLGEMLEDALKNAGYNNLRRVQNGLETWELIDKWGVERTVSENVRCVITDIEMPQMDGHTLTKMIKKDHRTKSIKVVIFSSMINEATRTEGELIGADAQISKPELDMLVDNIDQLLRA